MNVYSMKLDTIHLTIPNEDKSKDTSGQKKCKVQKKKNISRSCDKDALLNNNGLGHKFSDKFDINTYNLNQSVKNDCTKRVKSKKECPKIDKMFTESDKIQDRLQRFLSTEHKEKIMCILNDIRSLSDIEKLYLYLQLPTGSPFEVDPFKQKIQNPLGKKADEEGMFAVTWIQSHLEEDPDVSLPKQEVYDEYQSYCNMRGTDALCAADFGKVMKQIFPSVKPRRLGTRGNSRYCYSGLRKKLKLTPPSIPDLQMEKESCLDENMGDEVTSAACHLLFEWAEKLLGIQFCSLKELAAHLLENMYVDNRSVAAFTLLLDASPELLSKGFAPEGSGTKKSEAQFHLQRKIQEKELIKEQKRKLQEQRTSLAVRVGGKGVSPKKKGSGKLARKMQKAMSCPPEKSESDKKFENTGKDKHKENELLNNCADSTTELVVSPEVDIKQEDSFCAPQPAETISSPKVVDPPLSSLVLSPLSSPSNGTLSEVEETKIFISQNKTPVCIAQSLPGIIIVPSLPQLTGDIGKQNANTPKYKRIQPKPLQGDIFNTVTRSRAGSVGSSLPSKPKTRNVDGRRSSHACLQSENIAETGDEKLSKSISASADSSFRSVHEKKSVLQSAGTLKDDIQFETPHNLISKEQLESVLNVSPNDARIIVNEQKKKMLELKSNPIQQNCSLEAEDSNSIKRHLDEKDEHADYKRVHLDPYKLSWIPSTLDADKVSNAQTSNKQYTRVSQEEVSVHDIEGDALNDYFRGGNSIHPPILSLQQQFSSNTKVQQLSQLRMLLEQNLPNAVSKMATSSVKIQKVFKQHENANETTQANISGNIEKSFTPIVPAGSKLLNADIFFQNPVDASNVVDGLLLKNDSLERMISLPFQMISEVQADSQLLSDPNIFLNSTQSNIQDMDVSLHSELNRSVTASDALLPSSTLLSGAEFVDKQESISTSNGRVSTCTQVPSVPQSPNTRRRAFNFMPISPRQTPVPEGANGLSSISSPHLRTMISTAVGPSQPPSNSGSPFVSPRSTPVPLCRSRHSSGQSSYSTSRHTPFQNFDSGVSSVSSSPFISPQPTPVPVSRLRHNSSKTVTFCSINTPPVIHSTGPLLRTRHSSGPGAPHAAICSPRSSSLSPLVSESSFVFPSSNEVRSRHNSGSNTTTPMSPISEQASSSSSCTSNIPDLSSVGDASLSQSFLNDGAGDLLISATPTSFKQVRHRHASSSVIYGKTSFTPRDIFSQEIQKLLKNYQENGTHDVLLSNRSQSVPLHQMLQNADSYCLLPQPIEDISTKSHPSTPVMNQMFSFPLLSSNLCVDASGKDKVHASQMEWTETGSVRRNLTTLYDVPPPSDDLQTTLEDLRDCDTDFSKLELELRQNEESGL